MKYFKILYVVIFICSTNGNKIKIEFDSSDALKLLRSFISSYGLKDVAAQIFQRANVKKGIYNNPYHPEDDVVNAEIDTKFKEKHKQILPKKEKIEDKNDAIDKKIEADNENFIAGGQMISADEFDDVKNATESTHFDDNVGANNETQKLENKTEILSDRHNFKMIQKRFMLMKS